MCGDPLTFDLIIVYWGIVEINKKHWQALNHSGFAEIMPPKFNSDF